MTCVILFIFIVNMLMFMFVFMQNKVFDKKRNMCV